MAEINNYLFFHGNCAEAMRFYEKTLGGKLNVMTHGDSPVADKMPPGSKDRVMHARLDLDGGGILMASDDMATDTYKGMTGFSVCLVYPTVAAAKGVFEALARGGSVVMPFDKTFWAEGFGMLVDRFGTPWMISAGMAPSV